MSERPIRLGAVGVGDVAHRDYLPEIGRLGSDAEVVAVAGAREERAQEVAERLGARWYVGYRALLENDEVDAVLDLTPPRLHEEVNRAALEAGQHVYSEKPVASTAAAARSLADLAEARGLVLAAAPSVLVFPQVRLVRGILASGGLGRVVAASGSAFGGVPPWEGYASDPSFYFAEDVGPLVDVGVYPLHALTGLLGPARRASATARRTRDRFEVLDGPARGAIVPIDVEDLWQLTLELGDGIVAAVHASFASAASSGPELEILGDQGAVACSLLDPAAPVRVDEGDGWRDLTVDAERTAGPDHVLGVRHFVGSILGEEEPVLGAGHAAHVLDVIEAARRSSAGGRAVEVPDHGWSPPTRTTEP